jgi:hypothetical protein
MGSARATAFPSIDVTGPFGVQERLAAFRSQPAS